MCEDGTKVSPPAQGCVSGRNVGMGWGESAWEEMSSEVVGSSGYGQERILPTMGLRGCPSAVNSAPHLA